MTAIRAQIVATIEARLAAIDEVREVVVMPSGDPVKFPALHIFDDGHAVDESDTAGTKYGFIPRIEGYIEGSSGAVAYAQINDLYAATIRNLVTDPPIDGLAETVDEGDMRLFVATLASKPRLGFTLDLPISFYTDREDPAKPA